MASDLLTLPQTSDEVAAISTETVRTPALQVGENYSQRKWPTPGAKKESFRVVQFLGAGTSSDVLLNKVPAVKGLAADVRFWFNIVNAVGEIETIGLTTDNGGALLEGEGNLRGRVTFRKLTTEVYPAVPAKVPAAKVVDPNKIPAKRGRKAKVVEAPVAPVVETIETPTFEANELPVTEAELPVVEATALEAEVPVEGDERAAA